VFKENRLYARSLSRLSSRNISTCFRDQGECLGPPPKAYLRPYGEQSLASCVFDLSPVKDFDIGGTRNTVPPSAVCGNVYGRSGQATTAIWPAGGNRQSVRWVLATASIAVLGNKETAIAEQSSCALWKFVPNRRAARTCLGPSRRGCEPLELRPRHTIIDFYDNFKGRSQHTERVQLLIYIGRVGPGTCENGYG